MGKALGRSESTDISNRLPETGIDGRARAAALAKAPAISGETGWVEYRSAGRILVKGAATDPVIRVLAALDEGLAAVGLVSEGGASTDTEVSGRPIVAGRLTRMEGHLGDFTVVIDRGYGEENLAHWLGPEQQTFDLVLDLAESPYSSVSIPPPGYYHPGSDPETLGRILQELPEMIGEFEKPRYFHYQPSICAHGSRGQRGCTRCLDTCPTGAIASMGERIEVDPYLCQGCGICATACPTGAMTYTYPTVSTLLDGVRRTFKAFRENGGTVPCALFHDGEQGADLFWAMAETVPERILPFQVEEVTALGMEAWFAVLAYGAGGVVILLSNAQEIPAIRELRAQVSYAREILAGLGWNEDRLQLVETSAPESAQAALDAMATEPAVPSARFAALGGKRDILDQALDHLYGHAPAPAKVKALSQGAPFGEVQADPEACTLCMACVSICPAGALLDGDERPQVRFLEANCVQCGLCEGACPEDAITLAPRKAFAPELAKEERVLHEEEPFFCIGCGKAFATRSMVERMTEKLARHWMYEGSEAMNQRLRMCGDCRVKDMFAQEGGFDVHNKP